MKKIKNWLALGLVIVGITSLFSAVYAGTIEAKTFKDEDTGALWVEDAAPGKPFMTLQGKDYIYTLVQLKPKDASRLFDLMAGNSSDEEPVENLLFKNTKIANSEDATMAFKTSLTIGGVKVVSRNGHFGDEQSFVTQPELLLLGVSLDVSNSCRNYPQILVVRGVNGFRASELFGHCGAQLWEDPERNTAYLFYAATQSHGMHGGSPMEIIAISRQPRSPSSPAKKQRP